MRHIIVAALVLFVFRTNSVAQWQVDTQSTSMGRWSYHKPGSSGNLGYGVRTDTGGGWAWQLLDGSDNAYFHVSFPTGDVGLGTTTPSAKLDVNGVTLSKGIRIPGRYVYSQSESAIEMELPAGSYNAIRGYRGSQHIGTIHWFDLTWGSSSPVNSAGAINIDGQVAVTIGGWNDASKITYFRKNDGFVGIGTTNPDAKLTVKGIIHAEEVKVDLAVPGPDYVFEENYPLLSLEDTKNYITENKHLPGIPSSDEMQANGVNLLEMNMKLLEKVEELTLYLIEMKGQNNTLQLELLHVKEEIKELKSEMK